jgi:hypothetical protein
MSTSQPPGRTIPNSPGTPKKVRNLRSMNYVLTRQASDVRARSTHIPPLDNNGSFALFRQRPGDIFACLATAKHQHVITLYGCHLRLQDFQSEVFAKGPRFVQEKALTITLLRLWQKNRFRWRIMVRLVYIVFAVEKVPIQGGYRPIRTNPELTPQEETRDYPT